METMGEKDSKPRCEICGNLLQYFVSFHWSGITRTRFIGFTFRSSIDCIELALEVSEFSEIILNLHLKDVSLNLCFNTIPHVSWTHVESNTEFCSRIVHYFYLENEAKREIKL